LLEQACGACLDEDDIDRVRGRVVQVAGDAGSFLSSGEAAFALHIVFRAAGALDQVRVPAAPLADLVADGPGAAPDEHAEQDRAGREAVVGDQGAADVDREHAEHHDRGLVNAGSTAFVGGDEEERDRRPERRAEAVPETVQGRARRGGKREYRERRAPPREQWETGKCRECAAECVEVPARAVHAVHHGERETERHQGDGEVAEYRRLGEPADPDRCGGSGHNAPSETRLTRAS